MADEKIQTAGGPPSASSTSVPSTDVEFLRGSIDEKKLLRKLDLRLLPAVSILYLLSFLDRSNGMPVHVPDLEQHKMNNGFGLMIHSCKCTS